MPAPGRLPLAMLDCAPLAGLPLARAQHDPDLEGRVAALEARLDRQDEGEAAWTRLGAFGIVRVPAGLLS